MTMSQQARHAAASAVVSQLIDFFEATKPDDDAFDVVGRCTYDTHDHETLLVTVPGACVRIRVDVIPATEVNDVLGPEFGIVAFKVPHDLSELDGA